MKLDPKACHNSQERVAPQDVLNGLRHGFDAGFRLGKLKGVVAFKNYRSALDNRDTVSKAVYGRVDKSRTVVIGDFREIGKTLLSTFFGDARLFPMGSAKKKDDPTISRPTDDHTRTGFNAHTVLGILGHSLDAYNQVCTLLTRGAFMRVSDVADAFTLIPMHPMIWAFMLFRWYRDSSSTSDSTLFVHIFGDFGTRGDDFSDGRFATK